MGWMDFFIKLNRYSDDKILEFSMNMRQVIEEECMTSVKGVFITLIEDVLSIVIGLPIFQFSGLHIPNQNRPSHIRVSENIPHRQENTLNQDLLAIIWVKQKHTM